MRANLHAFFPQNYTRNLLFMKNGSNNHVENLSHVFLLSNGHLISLPR